MDVSEAPSSTSSTSPETGVTMATTLLDWVASSEASPFTVHPPDSMTNLVQTVLMQDNAHHARYNAHHAHVRGSDIENQSWMEAVDGRIQRIKITRPGSPFILRSQLVNNWRCWNSLRGYMKRILLYTSLEMSKECLSGSVDHVKRVALSFVGNRLPTLLQVP